MKQTKTKTKTKTEKETIIIDAADRILGRLSARIAVILRSKDKPGFLPYKQGQQRVIVYNTDKLKFTGKKLEQQKHYRHSNYPGGLKETSLKIAMDKDSRKVLRQAVFGMLPKNRLRSGFLNNLILFKSDLPKDIK